jgi:hypothetical protein
MLGLSMCSMADEGGAAMKLNRVRSTRVALAAALLALGIGSTFAGDVKVLTTVDGATMGQWYGRAGGLVGAERIEAITKATSPGGPIGITYDKDVAARTNVPRQDAGNGTVGITYDKDVADRTNMSRGEKGAPMNAVSAKPGN